MNRAVVLPLHGIDLAAEPPFRVGGASVDPHSRDATFAGGRERLQPQVLKVLVALARRRGDVVTRDELIAFCWDSRIVGEDVINRTILVLRQFAKRVGGFRIETVPRAGYRLVETDADTPRRRLGMVPALLIAGLLAAVAIAAFYLGGEEASAKPPVPTIAVLPFDHQAADPALSEFAAQTRDYLSHMLSEGGFPVRLLASASDGDRRTADLIISGEARRQGGTFRATVRIEQPAPRIIVYSQQFESSGADAMVLPERIGAQVAATLSWTGALMILDPRYKTDPPILADLFKNTTLIVHGGDVLQSYEIARRLAPRAPGQPMAQLSLAFNTGFALEGLPLEQRPAAVVAARHAGNRAIAVAPWYGDVYATWCFLNSPVRLRECEDRLRFAMQRDPDAPFVNFFLSGQLDSTGRFAEALELARQSLANDRFKLWKIGRVLRALETEGRSAEADRLHREANRWWPNHPGLIWNRWAGLLAAGNFAMMERYEQAFATAIAPAQRTPPALFGAIRTRDAPAVRKSCAEVGARAPHLCLVALATIGDNNAAFAIADTLYPRVRGRSAVEEDALWLRNAGGAPLSFLSAPATARLRRDGRFLSLAERTGLLGYWRSGRLPDFCSGSPEPLCARLREGPRVDRFATRLDSDPFTKFNMAAQ